MVKKDPSFLFIDSFHKKRYFFKTRFLILRYDSLENKKLAERQSAVQRSIVHAICDANKKYLLFYGKDKITITIIYNN